MIRWFQIKKLTITKFHYISRPTTFILVVFPFEVVWKNSNFKIQTYFCMTKWFQTKTLSTTKFHNSSIPTTFMLVVFSFEVVFKIQILNFLNSDVVSLTIWLQMKKLPATKFITSQDLQSLFWLFGHLFISHDGSNNMHKYYTSLSWF